MPLPPTPSADSWPDEILAAAKGEFWAVVDVYLPGSKGKYEPSTGKRAEGAAETVLIADRPARVQQAGRIPTENAGAFEWGNKRRYIVQVELMGDDPLITDTARVRVKSAQRHPQLTQLSFQVTGATMSDHAPILTIQVVTEARAVTDG